MVLSGSTHPWNTDHSSSSHKHHNIIQTRSPSHVHQTSQRTGLSPPIRLRIHPLRLLALVLHPPIHQLLVLALQLLAPLLRHVQLQVHADQLVLHVLDQPRFALDLALAVAQLALQRRDAPARLRQPLFVARRARLQRRERFGRGGELRGQAGARGLRGGEVGAEAGEGVGGGGVGCVCGGGGAGAAEAGGAGFVGGAFGGCWGGWWWGCGEALGFEAGGAVGELGVWVQREGVN